ncbi:MAG: ABC transporter substrate-binding protein [Spirochaetota bacterium]|nr:ABC transporter substrate-binding protein [Spirochaetota bacterium]
MKKRFLQSLLVLFVALITHILIFSHSDLVYAKKARGVSKDTIKIGVIIDLTGPTSNIGVVMVEAYKNYTRYINDEGGIYGRKLKIIIEDDRYSIPAGISAFKKLVFKDQTLAILGPISIGETKVLFRHIAKNKIPTLPWAPDRSIMNPYKRYIFPTNGFYDNEWGVIYDHIINTLKPKKLKLAMATVDVESGKVVIDSAKDWAKFYGQKLHLETLPISAIDVTSQILGMKRARVTHVLAHHVAPGIATVLKDMKKFGFNLPLFGLSASCTEDILRIAGDASKNYVGASPYSSWYEESPGMAKLRKISMKYNPDAEKAYRIKSYSMGWVVAEILLEGLRRAGKNVNGEKLVTALETIKDFDTKGICGLITYTPQMHYGLKFNKLFRADPKSNRLIPITKWKLPPSRN